MPDYVGRRIVDALSDTRASRSGTPGPRARRHLQAERRRPPGVRGRGDAWRSWRARRRRTAPRPVRRTTRQRGLALAPDAPDRASLRAATPSRSSPRTTSTTWSGSRRRPRSSSTPATHSARGATPGGDPVSLVAPEDTAAASYRRSQTCCGGTRDARRWPCVPRFRTRRSCWVAATRTSGGCSTRNVRSPSWWRRSRRIRPVGVDVTTAPHSTIRAARAGPPRGEPLRWWPGGQRHLPADLRAVAAYGLPGTLLGMPPEPLDEPGSPGCTERFGSRSSPACSGPPSGRAHSLPPRAQPERAEESHIQSSRSCLLLEDLLLRTVQRLARWASRCGPEGQRLGHLDHAEAAHRTYGDIDLLVPARSTTRRPDARRRRRPAPLSRATARLRPTVRQGHLAATPDGLEMDLHRTFTMGPYGESLALESCGGERLVHRRRDEVQALTQEARLLHAAYHAALGDRVPQLVPLRDVAQILLTKDLDWQRLRTLMRASHGEAVVARAIRTTGPSCVWPTCCSPAPGPRPTSQPGGTPCTCRSTAHPPTTRPLVRRGALDPPWQRPRYVFALAFPERAYLRLGTGSRSRLLPGVDDIRENRSR